MNNITISITNSDQIVNAFHKAPELMRKALPKAVNKSLLTIGADAAKNAPYATGNLSSSILDPERGLKLANDSNFISGSVGSGVGYGAFVESGTRFMRARPYLEPAVFNNHGKVERFFTEAVEDVLSQVARNL